MGCIYRPCLVVPVLGILGVGRCRVPSGLLYCSAGTSAGAAGSRVTLLRGLGASGCVVPLRGDTIPTMVLLDNSEFDPGARGAVSYPSGGILSSRLGSPPRGPATRSPAYQAQVLCRTSPGGYYTLAVAGRTAGPSRTYPSGLAPREGETWPYQARCVVPLRGDTIRLVGR